MKQERDAAFFDLEALKDEQENQMNGLLEEAKYWESERYVALENDDIDTFNEFQKYYDEALAKYDKARNKFEGTVALFEVERVAKETREREEEAKS